jgi:hypothetical protein
MHRSVAFFSLPRKPHAFSPAFLEVLGFCSGLQNPGPHDLKALTAIYRCVRHQLDDHEKIYTAKILGLLRLRCPRA